MGETQRGQDLQGLRLLYLDAFQGWDNGVAEEREAYLFLCLEQLALALLLGRGRLRGGHGSVSFTWLVSRRSRKLSIPVFYQEFTSIVKSFANFAETCVSAIIAGQKRGTPSATKRAPSLGYSATRRTS